jgi:hypothetical protein
MAAYDDESLSCPMCSIGLDAEALCDCDVDPMCVRCHRVNHVELTWVARRAVLDRQIRDGLSGWGQSA